MSGWWIALATAAGVALAVTSSPPRATAVRVRFPARRSSKAELRDIAKDVERELAMPGFADFAVSVAENESKFNNLAIDDSAGALREAARGYDGNPKRYGTSPYPRKAYTWGTGGWYQMLPSTALADRDWNHRDPMLVFAPVASTILLAAFVQRVQRNHFSKLPADQRSWLAVRRFLRSNTAGLDWQEQLYGTKGKRERYARDLQKHGIPTSFMYELVPTNTRSATPGRYQQLLKKRGITEREDLS